MQLVSRPSIGLTVANGFCLEVLPGVKREIISCKYIFQYAFSAGSIASRLPTLNALGVGWAFTISRCQTFVLVLYSWIDLSAAIAATLSGVIVLGVIMYKPSSETASDSDRSIA